MLVSGGNPLNFADMAPSRHFHLFPFYFLGLFVLRMGVNGVPVPLTIVIEEGILTGTGFLSI